MSPRGGWRGGGRPPKTEGEKREHFGCRIKASNLAWLNSTKELTEKSTGEIIDFALEALKDDLDKLSELHPEYIARLAERYDRQADPAKQPNYKGDKNQPAPEEGGKDD